jgi:hypothetical protein
MKSDVRKLQVFSSGIRVPACNKQQAGIFPSRHCVADEVRGSSEARIKMNHIGASEFFQLYR